MEFLAQRHGHEKLVGLVEGLLADYAELREMSARLARRRKLADLVRFIYGSKTAEAEAVTIGDVQGQVRYVMKTPPGRELLRALLGDTFRCLKRPPTP